MPHGKPQAGSRIHWTHEERAAVLQVAIKIYTEPPFPPPSIEMFTQAQQRVLPKQRWRPALSGTASLLLKEVREEIVRQRGRLAPLEAIPAPPPEPPRRRAADAAPPPPTPVEAMVDAVANALAQILVQTLTHPEVLASVRALNPAMPAAEIHRPFGVNGALRGPTKLRVLIAGVKNNQAQALKPVMKELGINAEFWSKDESDASLRLLSRHADAAIGMVSFIAHKHDQILKTTSPKYMRVAGGVSAIAEKLRTEFPQQPIEGAA